MDESRRRVLRRVGAVGAAAGLTGLAGCSGGGDDGNGDGGATDTPTVTTTRAPTTTAPDDGNLVEMTDTLKYVPETIEVGVGETVTWETVGAVAHSVTAYADRIPAEADYFASGGFDSQGAASEAYPDGAVGQGETYEHTFDVPGTYEYYCIPHESGGMVGEVVVTE